MTTDGVLGAAFLPTDGYIDPSQLTFALAEGARRGGAEIDTKTRVTAIGVERRTRHRRRDGQGLDRGRDRRQRGRHVRGGDRPARGGQRARRPDGARVRRDEARRASRSTCRPCGTRRCSSTSAPESGGLVMGGYERDPAPWSLDGIPADFNGRLLGRGLAALRASCSRTRRRVPDARGDGGRAADQRAGGVHARRRVHPRPDRRARLLGRGRLLRARARRRRAGWASSSPSGSLDGRPEPRRLGDGLAPLRPPLRAAASTRSPARSRSTRPTTTSSTPATSGEAGRPLRVSPTYGRLQELGAAFGEKSGWERAELVRAERGAAATSRCARAAGPAGSGRPRSAPSTARRARRPRSSTRRRSPRSRSRGDGRRRLPRAAVRQPRRARRRRDHVHVDAERARRDRVRLHGHAARRKTASGS